MKLDKPFLVEQFEATVPQSTVPPPSSELNSPAPTHRGGSDGREQQFAGLATEESFTSLALKSPGGSRFTYPCAVPKKRGSDCRDERPAIKGFRPPEHRAAHSIRSKRHKQHKYTVACDKDTPLSRSLALQSSSRKCCAPTDLVFCQANTSSYPEESQAVCLMFELMFIICMFEFMFYFIVTFDFQYIRLQTPVEHNFTHFLFPSSHIRPPCCLLLLCGFYYQFNDPCFRNSETKNECSAA